MKSTLVLNADAMPVSVVPLSTVDWKDAIRIIFLDRAAVIEEYGVWIVRSPSIQVRMPSVIMLNEHQKHNGKTEFSKYNVYLRDNFHCQYCNEEFEAEELTFDHYKPRSKGGITEWENIVTACYRCNQEKAHFDSMKPKSLPRKPSYWELAAIRRKRPITVPHESWVPYLCWESDVFVDESQNVNNASDEIEYSSLSNLLK